MCGLDDNNKPPKNSEFSTIPKCQKRKKRVNIGIWNVCVVTYLWLGNCGFATCYCDMRCILPPHSQRLQINSNFFLHLFHCDPISSVMPHRTASLLSLGWPPFYSCVRIPWGFCFSAVMEVWLKWKWCKKPLPFYPDPHKQTCFHTIYVEWCKKCRLCWFVCFSQIHYSRKSRYPVIISGVEVLVGAWFCQGLSAPWKKTEVNNRGCSIQVGQDKHIRVKQPIKLAVHR